MTVLISPELQSLLEAVGSLDRAKLLVMLRESPRLGLGIHVVAAGLGVGTESARRMVRELSHKGLPVDVIAGVALLTDESPVLDQLVSLYRDDLGGLANLFAQQAINRLRELAVHGLPVWGPPRS